VVNYSALGKEHLYITAFLPGSSTCLDYELRNLDQDSLILHLYCIKDWLQFKLSIGYDLAKIKTGEQYITTVKNLGKVVAVPDMSQVKVPILCNL
jgi:hypothetical protein